MPLRIIYVDMNSYFASVEQAEDPKLIGRPLAVVPSLAETTCCLAASYPAKARGVRTGTLVRDAKKLCPGIVFIEADHQRYVSYHHRILEAVEKCFPVWKVFSIDEMAIQLFGREQETGFAVSKAREIKERIKNDVHPALTCSIGIAPNRYVAKIASDMQKPDGLVVIKPEELPQRLFELKLRDFPGIGPRMEEKLFEARCYSGKILCEKSLEDMRKLWGGKSGEDFWHLIRGEVLQEQESDRGSISHSRVLAPEKRNPEQAWSNLVALTSKAAMRLREEGYYARGLQLSLSFFGNVELRHWDKRSRFFETQDTLLLLKELSVLWESAPRHNIMKIGVALSSLIPTHKHQFSLFEDKKQTRLMTALDKINRKKRNLVVIGSSAELENTSHAPVAFGHIPEEFE